MRRSSAAGASQQLRSHNCSPPGEAQAHLAGRADRHRAGLGEPALTHANIGAAGIGSDTRAPGPDLDHRDAKRAAPRSCARLRCGPPAPPPCRRCRTTAPSGAPPCHSASSALAAHEQPADRHQDIAGPQQSRQSARSIHCLFPSPAASTMPAAAVRRPRAVERYIDDLDLAAKTPGQPPAMYTERCWLPVLPIATVR